MIHDKSAVLDRQNMSYERASSSNTMINQTRTHDYRDHDPAQMNEISIEMGLGKTAAVVPAVNS